MKKDSKLSTQPYKGARDFYPEDLFVRDYIFGVWRKVCRSYGYEEYDGPFLEAWDLYAAKSGEEIVDKQLYWFKDRGERKIAIRAEMTPTLARMVAGRLNQLPKPIRWFSIPNLWRYERPQKGRLREHYQLNVDSFGIESLDAEVEVFQIAVDIMGEFNAPEGSYKIKFSNRRFFDRYLEEVVGIKGADAKRLLMRIIDRYYKIPKEDTISTLRKELELDDAQIGAITGLQEETEEQLEKYPQVAEEIATLLRLVKDSGIGEYVEFDPNIVRGLDYYTGTVFEMFDIGSSENPRAMFGGGRYDDLVSIFNGGRLTGTGFGWGDVTMRNFLETYNLLPAKSSSSQVLVTVFDENTKSKSLNAAGVFRSKGLNTQTYLMGGKLNKQFRYANQQGIRWVVVIGPDEIANGLLSLKDMELGDQEQLDLEKAVNKITEAI